MLIALTTDFGTGSDYVAALKGAILSINPQATLIDLTHEIPPQDLIAAALFLEKTIPSFPEETIHVVVVDPGVGTERAILLVQVAGQYLVVPDNGCWTSVLRKTNSLPRVVRLTEPRFWRQPVSNTFHGRDILGPVAGWLSKGEVPEAFGPVVSSWVQGRLPEPMKTAKGWQGEVLAIDHFGNLITNIPAEFIRSRSTDDVIIELAGIKIRGLKRAYGEVPTGTLVAVISSSGYLEVAETNGNAAARLKACRGMPVIVGFS
jgi:S-adenosyl-L-methionine hydrolase (adenosine-forming)